MNDLVPDPTPSEEDDGVASFVPPLDLLNTIQYLQFSGDRMEHFIRNGLPIKLLIEQEANGLGHLTITDCLDALQLLRTTGQSESYDDLEFRRVPINPPKTDLQKENEAYRQLLVYMIREFDKKSLAIVRGPKPSGSY